LINTGTGPNETKDHPWRTLPRQKSTARGRALINLTKVGAKKKAPMGALLVLAALLFYLAAISSSFIVQA
jgi:hypothetical protein